VTKGSPPISSRTKTKAFTRIISMVTTGIRVGRLDASPSGISPPIPSSSIPVNAGFSRRVEPANTSPRQLPFDASAHYAANDDGDDDVLSVALRTANDIITRATPLKIMLIPTSVPIAQAELDGHCA